jgi:molybdopterin synthase catalytic subunit
MEAMDRLKSDVAIWKKEYFEDGAVRAEGPSSDALLASQHACTSFLERLPRE